MSSLREAWVKVLSTVAAAGIIGLGAWAWTWGSANIVLASDLEGLADMLSMDLRRELAPLIAEIQETNETANQNADDIRSIRMEATEQAIRGLRKEIQDMQQRREADPMWSESDELLLEEWREDLEILQQLREALAR